MKPDFQIVTVGLGCDRRYRVLDASGRRVGSTYPSRSAAQDGLAKLRAAQRGGPPAALTRRAAYRRADGNPWLLSLLKPPATQTRLQRLNRRWLQEAKADLEFWARKPRDVSPSDWKKQLPAAVARRFKGEESRAQAAALARMLEVAGVPRHQHASRIAPKLGLTPAHVRRLLK